MDYFDLDKRIVEHLYRRRKIAPALNGGAIEVTTLARELGSPTLRVAAICQNLGQLGLVHGERNLTGFVSLSDAGAAYYEGQT